MIAVEGGRRIDIEFPAEGGDHIRRVMLRRGWYEKDMLLDLQRRIRRRGLALDIGAYCGTHTLWMAKVCGLDVVAFEPQAEAYRMLRRNLEANRVRGTRVVHAAVGEHAGTGRIIPGEQHNTGMARFIEDPAGEIEMLTIDDQHFEDVLVMKIDVEGGELAVLRGARETIARCRPVIYVEAVETLAAVEEFFTEMAYRRVGVFNDTPTYCFVPIPTQTRVSFAIMAHPRRERHIPYLRARLGEPVEVVWDERNDRWHTGRRSLLAYDPAATHHVVVQDDAIVCEDFRAGVGEALRFVPDNPVGLYAGSIRPRSVEVAQRQRLARAAKVHWFSMDGPWWGVAVAIPTKFISDLVAFGDKQAIPNYDTRIAMFFRSIKVPCWYTFPSLVDHRAGKDEPSLVAGRSNVGDRVALKFIGENASALLLDWSRMP